MFFFQVFLVFAAVFGVLLSASACYGLCLAVGLTFGLTHQGLIFLLLGLKYTLVKYITTQ